MKNQSTANPTLKDAFASIFAIEPRVALKHVANPKMHLLRLSVWLVPCAIALASTVSALWK